MKYLLVLLLVFCSCGDRRKNYIDCIVEEWIGKEVLFPSNATYSVLGERDTINLLQLKTGYRIISYVDSKGCINCKLQLPYWKKFINEVDSVCIDSKIPFLFYFHPKNESELYSLLKSYNFTYPICVDANDSLNKLNRFPADMMFQTFLLDSNNTVLAIGNPILNPKIRELYLDIIQGKKVKLNNRKNVTQTKIKVDKVSASLGAFDYRKAQKVIFTLENVGDNPLFVENVSTSCGCISVNYVKEPIRSGNRLSLEMTYTAEHPEHFDKTITVYCNAVSSPIKLSISGNAE